MTHHNNESFTEKQAGTRRAVLCFIILFSIIFAIKTCTPGQPIRKPVIVYDEFQYIYDRCNVINSDLCNMKILVEADTTIKQKEKEKLILDLKKQLYLHVREYNSKSKMFNESSWNSRSLPYKLLLESYSCYGLEFNGSILKL